MEICFAFYSAHVLFAGNPLKEGKRKDKQRAPQFMEAINWVTYRNEHKKIVI